MRYKIIIILGILTLFCLPVCATTNIIYVSPGYQFIHQGETFNVLISCIPVEPVKSYEFKLLYDPDILTANSVMEGDFFSGYTTFFQPGIIGNGTIINIYDLIIGQGNVTTPGAFVIISFTAKNITGVSPILLYNPGITNETQYLPLSAINGGVQVYGDRYPWDINGDNQTNYQDISSLVSHYYDSFTPGEYPWDVVIDGTVNYLDISAVVNHYGQ